MHKIIKIAKKSVDSVINLTYCRRVAEMPAKIGLVFPIYLRLEIVVSSNFQLWLRCLILLVWFRVELATQRTKIAHGV